GDTVGLRCCTGRVCSRLLHEFRQATTRGQLHRTTHPHAHWQLRTRLAPGHPPGHHRPAAGQTLENVRNRRGEHATLPRGARAVRTRRGTSRRTRGTQRPTWVLLIPRPTSM